MGALTFFLSLSSRAVIITEERKNDATSRKVGDISPSSSPAAIRTNESSLGPLGKDEEPIGQLPQEVDFPKSTDPRSQSVIELSPRVTNPRRLPKISLSLGLSRLKGPQNKSHSAEQERNKHLVIHPPPTKRFFKALRPNSKQRAKKSALILRTVIVGPSKSAPKVTPAVANPQMNKIRSQLCHPKAANKIIAQLRTLPPNDATDDCLGTRRNGPIHAVCLSHTEREEDELHFSKLYHEEGEQESSGGNAFGFLIITSAPVEKLKMMLNELKIIDLVSEPDLGLGQPGDGKGLLAGALPTPETVIKGFEQITPQLMALGYATGRAMVPSHAGIYPPTDRISLLTYWWGLELLLPPPTLVYLSNAVSITNSVINFLSALSLVNNGVREILPFVRYISQFIEFEWNSIKNQNKGQGVVCAATWIMPAAMIPRPWDFPSPPADVVAIEPSSSEGKGEDQKQDGAIPDSNGDAGPTTSVPPDPGVSDPVPQLDASPSEPEAKLPTVEAESERIPTANADA